MARIPPIYSFLAALLVSATRVYAWVCLSDKIGATEFSDADDWSCEPLPRYLDWRYRILWGFLCVVYSEHWFLRRSYETIRRQNRARDWREPRVWPWDCRRAGGRGLGRVGACPRSRATRSAETSGRRCPHNDRRCHQGADCAPHIGHRPPAYSGAQRRRNARPTA